MQRPLIFLALSIFFVSQLAENPFAEKDATTAARRVIPAKTGRRQVDAETMQRIYEEVKTPYKYGIILKGAIVEKKPEEIDPNVEVRQIAADERSDDPRQKLDCPGVFRFGGKWYLTYIMFGGSGYESAIAESRDLLHWTPLGKTLTFGAQPGMNLTANSAPTSTPSTLSIPSIASTSSTQSAPPHWDAMQKAGYPALQDHTWGGPYELEQYDGKYWMTYIGGALKGYESDPLAIGLAWSTTPNVAVEWQRLPAPILSRDQEDVRYWEKLTQYKSTIIYDKSESLSYPFVMFYNGKPRRGHERIGLAVSNNMTEWLRYGVEPVVDNGKGISGDPQITKIGDVWVMFYFGAFWRPGAFDTFACSYDLVSWTKWTGPDLVAPSESWDKTFAHKPWVLKVDGVVYHFYCAVGDQGRVIALATSKPLNRSLD